MLTLVKGDSMKQLLALLIVAALGGIAHAQTLVESLYPSGYYVNQECDRGWNDPTLNLQPVWVETGKVNLIGPLGNAFQQCRDAKRAFKAKPNVTQSWFPVLMVGVAGTLKARDDAKGWSAILEVRDGATPIARVFPTPSLSHIASYDYWEFDCSGSGGCIYRGSNIYSFRTDDSAFKTAVVRGGTLFLLVQKDGRVTEYRIPPTIR
jgi:hypothetical protein